MLLRSVFALALWSIIRQFKILDYYVKILFMCKNVKFGKNPLVYQARTKYS
jgi:hypothetical protein